MLLSIASISQIKVQNPLFYSMLLQSLIFFFSVSASHFKSQVKFPCSPPECHQLSSMAADLEPDTRWGISLPCVSVWQPDWGWVWAEGGAHIAPCLRPTRRPPIASAPCLKSLPSCHLPTGSHTQSGPNNRGLRSSWNRLQGCVAKKRSL